MVVGYRHFRKPPCSFGWFPCQRPQVISSAGEVISVRATSASDGTDGDDPIPIQAVR